MADSLGDTWLGIVGATSMKTEGKKNRCGRSLAQTINVIWWLEEKGRSQNSQRRVCLGLRAGDGVAGQVREHKRRSRGWDGFGWRQQVGRSHHAECGPCGVGRGTSSVIWCGAAGGKGLGCREGLLEKLRQRMLERRPGGKKGGPENGALGNTVYRARGNGSWKGRSQGERPSVSSATKKLGR